MERFEWKEVGFEGDWKGLVGRATREWNEFCESGLREIGVERVEE